MKIKLTFKKATCPFCGKLNYYFDNLYQQKGFTCGHERHFTDGGWWFFSQKPTSFVPDCFKGKSVRYKVIKKELEI